LGDVFGTPLLQLADGDGETWLVKHKINDPAYDEAIFLFYI
jgi:hypothetical protein